MIDYLFIKQLVENIGEVDDISIKSRKRHIVNLRATYAKLCFLYIDKFTLAKCGKEINRDHATIIHALKIFKNDYGTKHFLTEGVFYLCNLKLKGIQSFILENKIKTDIDNIDLIIETYQGMKDKIINNISVNFEEINN